MQKNENRPGYRKTKVGWIPDDWGTRPLREVVDPKRPIGYGVVQTGPIVDDGIPCVRVVDLASTELDRAKMICTSPEISRAYKRTVLRNGDVMLALRGVIGCARLVPEELVDCNLTRGVALLSRSRNIATTFLAAVLGSQVGRRRLEMSVNGSALKEIPIGELRKVPIPLPSLPEQEAIAEVLECWDKAIRGYERKIEKKRNIKKGLMQRLLSGKQRLPGFVTTENTEGHGKEKDGIPVGWKKARLCDICNLQSGKFMAASAISEDRCESSFPCFGGNGLRGYVHSYSHDGEYALIGRQGALCGNVCWACGKFYATEHAVVATPTNDTSSKWLYYQLERLDLNRYATGVAQPGLSVQMLNQISTPVPAPPEQKAIATVLSSADAEIAALERKLAVLREQKRFLLNNMVTGTMRLPQFLPKEAS